MGTTGDRAATIAAVATPPGHGGIGVVRLSGAGVPALAEALLGTCPRPRLARYCAFRGGDGVLIDRGLALYFPAPRSATGEHVLELHGHGGPAVLDALLQRVLALGARLARPGEFSERSYLNGKLDLAQAEAVADLIAAGSRQAASAAARSLEGEFSRAVNALAAGLVELRVYVEAAIDFPVEEIDFLADGDVRARLQALHARIAALRSAAMRGSALREGLRLAIVGAPNVGKSSLLNRLAGRASAIVTAVPGTTRDVLRETIHIDGLALHLADTAGLRETSEPIEAEGVARARAEIARSDHVLVVCDDREPAPEAGLPPVGDRPQTRVLNKCDLSGNPPGATGDGGLRLSALSGAGFETLIEHLRGVAGLGCGEAEFMARRRHLDALDQAGAALARGIDQMDSFAAGELLAEDLRAAHTALGAITGEFSSDALLGEIFAGFCIGK